MYKIIASDKPVQSLWEMVPKRIMGRGTGNEGEHILMYNILSSIHRGLLSGNIPHVVLYVSFRTSPLILV